MSSASDGAKIRRLSTENNVTDLYLSGYGPRIAGRSGGNNTDDFHDRRLIKDTYETAEIDSDKSASAYRRCV